MKIYLDLDDVVKDTSSYLGKYFSDFYENGFWDRNLENPKLRKLLSEYDKIPYMEGALEGLKYLNTYHNLVIVSEFLYPEEAFMKKKVIGSVLFECNSISRIILVNRMKTRKYNPSIVNMSDGVLIDDSVEVLAKCNAKNKILYVPESRADEGKMYIGDKALNWASLLSMLDLLKEELAC